MGLPNTLLDDIFRCPHCPRAIYAIERVKDGAVGLQDRVKELCSFLFGFLLFCGTLMFVISVTAEVAYHNCISLDVYGTQ